MTCSIFRLSTDGTGKSGRYSFGDFQGVYWKLVSVLVEISRFTRLGLTLSAST